MNARLLSGKVALVTGAAAGIGESIAHVSLRKVRTYPLDIDLAGVEREKEVATPEQMAVIVAQQSLERPARAD